MKVILVNATEDPIMSIAKAASNCYDSRPHKGIVRHCYQSGHHSVLEFANFHLHISGVSRALSHQLVRHRIASYAQRSQRYVRENEFDYVFPSSIEHDEQGAKIFTDVMRQIQEAYGKLISLGIAAEDARAVLPNACETIIDVNMNLRSLMNFMNERLCSHAQDEIRELAREMKNVLTIHYPELEEYLVPKCEKLGYCTEGKKCCGRKPTKEEIFQVYEEHKKQGKS
jgi:thymidylate synthase (FAD)